MRLIDAIADWLRDRLGYRAQMRMGVILVLGSLPFYLYGPFAGEPPVIYYLSVVAVTLSGISIVVAAEAAEEASK